MKNDSPEPSGDKPPSSVQVSSVFSHFGRWRRLLLTLLLLPVVGGAALAASHCASARDKPLLATLTRIGCPSSATHSITVSTKSELEKALECAVPATSVVLKPGNYGIVAIGEVRGVKLTSAAPETPAIFRQLTIDGGEDVELSNLRFEGIVGSVPHHLGIWNSRGIQATDLQFRTAAGPAGGMTAAVLLRRSQRVEMRRLDITGPTTGITFDRMTDIVIADCFIHDFQSDGIVGTGSSQIVISGNHITEGHPAPGDHPDGIQLFTINSKESASDIVIKDNLIERGSGDLIQGIFLGDETSKLPYRNIRIEGNLIVGSMYHGIMLGGAIDATVINNTVIPSADMQNWIRIYKAQPLVFSGNIAQDFIIDQQIVHSGPMMANNRREIVSELNTRSMIFNWKLKHRRGETVQ